MTDKLKELQKFNVEYIECSKNINSLSLLNKDGSKYLFYSEVFLRIKKQKDGEQSAYFLGSSINENFLNHIIYSNKESHIVFQPEKYKIYFLDKSFNLLFSLNYFSSYNICVDISNQYFQSNIINSSIHNISLFFKDFSNDRITLSPNKKVDNQFQLYSSALADKISLLVINEDLIKVKFHQSTLQEIIFDKQFNIKHVEIIKTIFNQDISSYIELRHLLKDEFDLHNLLHDKSINIINENIFNEKIIFIKKLVPLCEQLKKNINIQHLNNILDHLLKFNFSHDNFNSVNQVITSFINNKQDNFFKNIQLLSVMKDKNYKIDEILTANIIDDICLFNNSLSDFQNFNKKTNINKIKKGV